VSEQAQEMDRKPSFLVGIAGGSASGKSTFTARLERELTGSDPAIRVEVIGMDRYFYRGTAPGPCFVSPSTGETMPDNNHPDSADNARLIADLDLRRSSDDAPDVILLEGLMALHVPAIRERCDLRLFMELDADVRALRRLMRDMSGVRGNRDPKFIVSYYSECARVGHIRYVQPSREHADLILQGDSDFDRIAPMIAAIIRSRLP
jgi:uridine kinase